MHSTIRLATIAAGILAIALGAPAQAANVTAGKAKAAVCAGCHGADGNGGADPTWPKLAGQDATYLAKQLKDFKSGARKDPIMAGMVAGLNEADTANLGAYYASLKASSGAARNAELAKAGEKLFRGGNLKEGVAACMSCHGPSGQGIAPRYPAVSGQKAVYTRKQLAAFKSGARKNDGEVMTRIAAKLSDADIEALAEYMAGVH
jgi:cytochrome c553